MKLKSKSGDCVEIQLTSDELMILNNALNEVCNGLDLPEFHTRMGAGREEVGRLLEEIHSIADT